MERENTIEFAEGTENIADSEAVFPEMETAEATALDGPVPVKPKKRKRMDAEEIYGTFLAAIPLIGFLIFGFVPLILAFFMAFLDMGYGWNIADGEWVGFDNFVFLFTTAKEEVGISIFEAIGNTLLLGISTFISQILALAVSYLLSRDIRGRGIWRIIYFIPYVCSTVAITLMWKYMFDPSYGIINQIIGNTDIMNGAIEWTTDPTVFYVTINIISIWSGMGYGILLYSAALTNINQSSLEAAEIDGAGSFTKFFRIVLPSISPTTFYLLIMGVIGMLQSFTITNVFDKGGGPDFHGVTIVFFMFQYLYEWENVGVASAAAWVLTLLILLVTVIQFFGSRRWVKYD